MSNVEPSQRAKFAKAFKHQMDMANSNPELFAKAQEITKRITDGDILWTAGIMVALQEGMKLAQESAQTSPQVPAILRRRTRS